MKDSSVSGIIENIKTEVIKMDKIQLQRIWDNLDKAYEYMEKAIEETPMLLPNELKQMVEAFDMGQISYMKQLVEEMMEEEE